MNTCDKCIKHDICGKREVFGAVGCADGFQPKPMTNADRVRNMSDMELAEFLDEFDSTHIRDIFCKYNCEKRINGSCNSECEYLGGKALIDYLTEESEE